MWIALCKFSTRWTRSSRSAWRGSGFPSSSTAKAMRNSIVTSFAEASLAVTQSSPALVCDEGVIATSFGLRYGETYWLLRISNAGKPWSSYSPGLLVTERTMAALHLQGVRRFDLSVGNHEYKRRFGARAASADRCQRCSCLGVVCPTPCAITLRRAFAAIRGSRPLRPARWAGPSLTRRVAPLRCSRHNETGRGTRETGSGNATAASAPARVAGSSARSRNFESHPLRSCTPIWGGIPE